MNTKYFKLGIILISLVSLQCKKDDNIISSEQNTVNFSGLVVDNKGNPVDSANIHFIYSLKNSSFGKTQQTNASIRILFSIPNKSFVKLRTSRWNTRETVETIVEDTLLAGNYMYAITSTMYTNGLYYVNLTAGSFTQEKYILVLDSNITTLITTDPMCKTNSSGQFVLPFQSFGFGYPITQTSEKDGTILGIVYISNTVQIVINKSGYKILTTTIVIDTTKGIKQTFKFE